MIVLDASIAIKLFRPDEPDADRARQLVEDIADGRNEALAPGILLYETLAAALHYEFPFTAAVELFERLAQLGFEIIEPDVDDILLAERIATSRAPSGGNPTLFDSIYHAIALNRGGIFVTADERHATKAASFGSVLLLSQWVRSA